MKEIVNKNIHYIRDRKYLLCIPVVGILILYLHYIHFTSFSFTDAYNSYARAYFLDKGRLLYSGIFSHHHMLMVYLSYIVQKVTQPDNLYQLVLYHRIFIGLCSVIFASLCIWKFRWVGLSFVVVYELSKYYLFGNLFLAESLVAYLLIYIFGIAWNKFHKNKVTKVDIIVVTLFAWLIFFLREPFIPLAGILTLYIYFDKSYTRLKSFSIIAFIISSLLILSTVKWGDYFFNMFTLNFGGYIQEEISSHGFGGLGLLKIFLYPFYVFISGQNNDFRIILLLLSSTFLISISVLILKKKYLLALFIVLSLGLANIRFREPGSVFYSGFHMLPWYSLFIFIISLLASKIIKVKEVIFYKYVVFTLIFGVVVISILPPYSTVYRGIDIHNEFNANYGRFYVTGEIIKILSDLDDNLFVDDWDTLVYWQSGLDSNYTYAMYFPVMSTVDKFSSEREKMFRNDPPEFYYTDCHSNQGKPLIPEYRMKDYLPLYYEGRSSCIYILNTKIKEISVDQWEQIHTFGFYLVES
jgi:hypothetical protein